MMLPTRSFPSFHKPSSRKSEPAATGRNCARNTGGKPLRSAQICSHSSRTLGGNSQHQHLVQTEFPPKVLEEWLQIWAERNGLPPVFRAQLRPVAAGSDFLELGLWNDGKERVGNIIFADVHDRHGHKLLSVRDMNTFDPSLRKKRLMTLAHLFLLHRYKAGLVHYLSPTEDNQHQALKMQRLGIFGDVNTEAGLIIVASINAGRIAELLNPDRVVLRKLINKED